MKTFVIDTNVLIHRPEAIFSFKNSNVVIPIQVLEDLDRLKSEPYTTRGKSARSAIRLIEGIIDKRNITKGVKMLSGGVLIIPQVADFTEYYSLDQNIDKNRIILTALAITKREDTVIFVSKNINSRIKAEALGIRAMDYNKHRVPLKDQYLGYVELEISAAKYKKLESTENIAVQGDFYPNQFCFFRNKKTNKVIIGRYNKSEDVFMSVGVPIKEDITGISAQNPCQGAALDALLDRDIKLVTIAGTSGTGKTLISIAASLRAVLESKEYSKVLLTYPVDRNTDSKLWTQPIFDTLELLIGRSSSHGIKSIDQLINSHILKVEPLTNIRGRKLSNQFIIVDDAQNLSPMEIKAVINIGGNCAKIVFIGNLDSIDHPYIDSECCGLVNLIDQVKSEEISAHITLTKGDVSPLSELSTKL